VRFKAQTFNKQTEQKMSKFGKASFAGKKSTSNTWRIKEGDNKYRLLPPMFSLIDEEKYTAYHGVHWGYEGVDRNNPTQTQKRPFRCIQERGRNGMTLQECPACAFYDLEEKRVEAQEAELLTSLRKEGKSDKEIEEIIDTALGADKYWLQTHNVDRKHYINAMTEDGTEFGQFLVSHRTKKAMDEAFDRLREEDGIDALDIDQGVIVNIRRTGKKREAVDSVEFVTEKLAGGGRKIKLRPLSEEEQERALKECKDLTTVGGTVLSFDQISAIVEANGDPQAIEAVFQGARQERSPKRAPAPQKPAPTPAPAPAPTPPPAQEKPAVDPAVAARLAAIAKRKEEQEAAARKAKEEAEAAAAAAAQAPVVEEKAIEDMSEEEFMAKYGPGNN
jgi:hypothetical protein